MTSRKLFWEDPYLTRVETSVSAVADDEVLLCSTIFFALSGGQERDHGTIGGFQVRQASKRGTDIWYALPDGHSLKVGQPVVVEIDWPRRYQLMRLHFAAELVLELVYRKLPGVKKTGAHISQDKARIDFDLPASIAEILPDIADAANAIVAANLVIVTGFEDIVAERRYWMINDFSRVPCGGTHVSRTGEVGSISLKRKNQGKNQERIEIYVALPESHQSQPSDAKPSFQRSALGVR
ncbi:MAG: alanyl-tRNA editing protein [Burkholderiales bacterium RIFOXYC12_FULL_60_6]|nr:MAG: alanyl-tRNA editing protein [Burkholderiales bacterium RIFOXYD12_FULL_59_19]OGB82591.1 MAG: alanyl-tRNA editing protein [Burkholderiales bacterium RIFOXYC12_FULL_60_6]